MSVFPLLLYSYVQRLKNTDTVTRLFTVSVYCKTNEHPPDQTQLDQTGPS